jgi:hypothetical protein
MLFPSTGSVSHEITRSALYPPTTTTFGLANFDTGTCFFITDAFFGSLEKQDYKEFIRG